MKSSTALALLLLSAAVSAQASDPPNQLSLQLRLADSAGTPLVGPVGLDVRVYDAPTGGNLLWAESQSATALAGVVAVQLGATTVLPADLFAGGERFLGLAVQGDPEMVPRTRLASAPFARRAATVAKLDTETVVPAGLIGGDAIADGAVGSAQLAPGAVGAASLAAGSVGTAALGADAVDATKLKPGAVTTTALAANAVLSSQIVDGTIANADVAALAEIQGTKITPAFGAQDVTTTGRLGVGTTSLATGADLQVRGDTSLGEILVTPTGTDSSAQLRMTENFTASLGMIQRYDGAANQWQLLGQNTGGVTSPHLVVERDAGEVGIGTAAPAARLHVNGVLRVDGSSGDAAVLLPDASISPDEQLAEPGIARDLGPGTVFLDTGLSTIPVKLASRTITCPANGYVVAFASTSHLSDPISGTYKFNVTTDASAIGIDATLQTMPAPFGQVHNESLMIERTFPVSAGANPFHFLASKEFGLELDTKFFDSQLTLIYFPSAYGVVDVQ